MNHIPAGRRRYLNWSGREALRQQVLKEQATALEEAGKRRTVEGTTRDEPERGYPTPRNNRRRK